MQKMQNLFNNRKVFYSVIIVLTLLFGVFSFLTIKSYSNKEEPKTKEKVLERETFTTYISDGNGHYKKYTSTDGTLYPSGYAYNQGISYCEDLDGNRLDIVPTYANNKFTLESDKTAFCYLYFDIKDSTFAEDLIASGELWSSGLEGDGYRYVGSGAYNSETTPNNFICFGTSDKTECKNNEAKYMYRIIGVFPDNNGNQHLKLISLKQLRSTYKWNDTDADVDWGSSTLFAGLNGSYFLTNTTYDYLKNNTWLNKIEDWTWSAVNTKTNSDSGPNYYSITTQEMYLHEMNRSSKSSSIGEWSTPTAKIGLMYASDYQMSLGSSSLSYTGSSNDATLKIGWMHQSNNVTTSSSYDWTISRSGLNGGDFSAWYVESYGNVNLDCVDYTFGARPVFYLTSDARVSDGNGSYSNPYILK